MITVISGSNRSDNKTEVFAGKYAEILKFKGEEVQLFLLEDLPPDLTFDALYDYNDSPVTEIVNKFILPAEKLVFVIPEYNGSFPGVLKAFIDAVEPVHFKGKKAALVGVAAGRAGNLRGMDHLTDILHYLQVEVLSLKVPVSRIYDLISEKDEIIDRDTLEVLDDQADLFLKF